MVIEQILMIYEKINLLRIEGNNSVAYRRIAVLTTDKGIKAIHSSIKIFVDLRLASSPVGVSLE